MTSHSTTDGEPDSAGLLARDAPTVDHFGSSVYGGRPTFALTRRDGGNGATVTLYELLPDDQATARSERLERDDPNRGLVTEPFEEVFETFDESEADRWSWDDWTAVKISRLSESRLRAIVPLVRETLEGARLDDGVVTSDGPSDVFLPETVGVRLALAFLGVKPIQRVDRMRAFCRGIARMSDEECYYWHAKCRSPSNPNGEKALRTMLTDHL